MALNFKNFDFDALNNVIMSIDWRHYLIGDSIDVDVSIFSGKMLEALAENVWRT